MFGFCSCALKLFAISQFGNTAIALKTTTNNSLLSGLIAIVVAEEHWRHSSGPLFLIAEKTLGFLIAFFLICFSLQSGGVSLQKQWNS